MNLTIGYKDVNGYSRWGYIIQDSAKILSDYYLKVKQQKQQQDNGEGNDEILDKSVEQMSEIEINVFLLDGTTGIAKLKHISIIPPFVQYKLSRPEPESIIIKPESEQIEGESNV